MATPTATAYTYSISKDFPGGTVNIQKLEIAIQNSTIVTPIQEIDTNGDSLSIVFQDVLGKADKTTLDGDQSRPAAGLIASTDNTPFLDVTNRYLVIGYLKGASLASDADQPIFMSSTKYVIRKIMVMNPSASIGVVSGGIYSGRNKTGNQVVPPTQSYAGLTAANKYIDLSLGSLVSTDVQTSQMLFLSLTSVQLSPATADFMIFGEDLS